MLFSFSAASTVATFHGQMEKQGPETSYTVGFASDEYSKIELDAPEKEGLNISYIEEFEFEPENISRSINREGQNIPVKEFSIRVSSVDPVRQSYEVPVTLRAYGSGSAEGRATPRVVHERKYTFSYLTENSPDYNFEGSLIGGETEDRDIAERNVSEENDVDSEENSLTEENQTSEQEELDKKESGEGVNPALLLGVLLVFSYVFYEAVT
ncbi:hypothetical protein LC1Nh_0214 [Candidatus Nanohalobium constans]|uniref:Uncharacterized protein n=2 Tax=Candidatus Nanohalobium constans TaxID=2565781 RepID=A0A5Q0UEZ1_9ARCH|nr:hypothetical protein LC1Nh_0214 [Candidatus Nanohalobium constans]